MRLEQRMMLAPRMIQSMEILQLPILALQERIEQELNNNPVLEIEEPARPEDTEPAEQQTGDDINEKDLVVDTDNNKAEDFERLESLDDEFKDFMDQSGPFYPRRRTDEPDSKLQALPSPCTNI
jgi:RNA polymerase sigma-54 factor